MSPRLRPPRTQFNPTDEAKQAWLNGWWSGNATGIAIGAGLVAFFLKAFGRLV